MKIEPDTIYLGDNGRALCGRHLGTTALFTGRDISGQPIYPVDPADPEMALIKCETCRTLNRKEQP